MKTVCLLIILLSALIQAFNLHLYYRTLRYMRSQSYERSSPTHQLYGVCLVMIAVFLVAYLAAFVIFLLLEFRSATVLVSVILLLGSLFVLGMVRVTQMMAENIASKTFEVIHALVDSIEAKDPYTMGHSMLVMQLSELLCQALPPEMRERVDMGMLKDAALLHDIGKLHIPDCVLNKPGCLDEGEFDLIRQHPERGYSMLDHTSYRSISPWVLYHHERMDGNGYYRLPADKIPLESRIMAVADTFSALTTDRIYRGRKEYDQAIQVLREAAGTQLDPLLVETFCTVDRAKIDRVSPASA